MSDKPSQPSMPDLAVDLLVNFRDQMLRPMHDSLVHENASSVQRMHESLARQLGAVEVAIGQAIEQATARSAAMTLTTLCGALKRVSWTDRVTPVAEEHANE